MSLLKILSRSSLPAISLLCIVQDRIICPVSGWKSGLRKWVSGFFSPSSGRQAPSARSWWAIAVGSTTNTVHSTHGINMAS